MVRIRLRRVGSRHQPHYRVVIAGCWRSTLRSRGKTFQNRQTRRALSALESWRTSGDFTGRS